METNNLENKILNKIKEEHLKPTSVWYFLVKDYSLWGLVFLSVLLAALSIAPIIFIIQNLELGYIKHISSNPFLFLLYSLPYTWIILCGITTYFATLAWAKTKNGYKFKGETVLIVSLFASLLLGLIFNFWNFGKTMDEKFHDNSFGYYKSMEQRRQENWFDPEDGRLIGVVSNVSTSSFRIYNEQNSYSEIVFYDESVPGSELVNDNNNVRVIGFENNDTDFLACAIFPDSFMPPTSRPMSDPMASTSREIMHQKIAEILELHPECKTVMDQGRANFQRNNPK